MRVCSLLHVPFEGLAAIGPWLEKHDHSVRGVNLYAGASLPLTSDFDWLIVMGGPMGANDVRIHPWLRGEKALIKKAIEERKIVLGICLGAQLIAAALGARVYANDHREIGWFPITSNLHPASGAIGRLFPETIEVFHWHGDTFDLPNGAQRLASSTACLNQAFCVGDKVLGLQFHLESTDASATRMIQHCSDEIASPGPFIQTADEMLAKSDRFEQANELLSSILTALAAT
jgi:GMP synthase (glutamine-hydrolysing)